MSKKVLAHPDKEDIIRLLLEGESVKSVESWLKEKYPRLIKEVRGRGFLIGLQLHKDQTNFIKKLMKNKLLTIRAAENVIRILPPLNVNKSEIIIALKIINKVCEEYKR